jgi:hypothetical protein
MPREQFAQNRPFAIKGHWWRPGGSNRPAGDLEYKDGGINLHLLGALDDAVGENPFSRQPEVSDLDIVHGESADGRPVTLLRAFYTAWQQGSQWLSPGPVPIVSSRLTCHVIVVGVHLASTSDTCFKACEISIPNLESWLADQPFSVTASELGEPIKLSVSYEMPPSRTFDISAEVGAIRIKHAVTPPGIHDGAILHRSYLSIEPTEPRTLDWFMEAVGQVERLFTLLFGHSVQTVLARLFLTSYRPEEAGGDALIYTSRTHGEPRRFERSDFLMRYPQVSAAFPQMLRSWFTDSSDIRHALNLLFSSIREPGAFLETRFLPIVQATEVFARAVLTGQIVEAAEYKRIRRNIVASIPADVPERLRESIVASLAFANEPRLADRLSTLAATVDAETAKLFCNDPREYIRGIVNTRNFFTHYTSRYDRILQGIEIHWATLKLTTMLRVLILKRLGLPEPQLLEMFRVCPQATHERQSWKDLSELGSPVAGADQE